MDFDAAAKRLQQDHQRLRAKQQVRGSSNRFTSSLSGHKDKNPNHSRILQYQQQQQQRKERVQQEKLQKDYLRQYQKYMEERQFGFLSFPPSVSLSSSTVATSSPSIVMATLQATSIHGQGDKITLPPSILERLTNLQGHVSLFGHQPLFFRLAIPRSSYTFPSSCALQSLEVPKKQIEYQQDDDDKEEDNEMENMENSHSKDTHLQSIEPYLHELSYQYVSYTFATVLEFTQDEGCIGLPQDIAQALLNPHPCDEQRTKDIDRYGKEHAVDILETTQIPSTFTVDPSMNPISSSSSTTMSTPTTSTPGHPAYGAFPIPLTPIQVSILTQIPLGTHCRLKPTFEAIQLGFYQLKDLQKVLEQNVIQTRATLRVGDSIHAWYRGKKYDVRIEAVEPSDWGVISCVNTDIVVDFVPHEEQGEEMDEEKKEKEKKDTRMQYKENGRILGGKEENVVSAQGQYLQQHETAQQIFPTTTIITPDAMDLAHESWNLLNTCSPAIDLPSEPPLHSEQEGRSVVTIQIRGDDNRSKRRRFDALNTLVRHLFAYVEMEQLVSQNPSLDATPVKFRLVTRFPRKVLDLESDGSKTLKDMGLGAQNHGQELLLVERY